MLRGKWVSNELQNEADDSLEEGVESLLFITASEKSVSLLPKASSCLWRAPKSTILKLDLLPLSALLSTYFRLPHLLGTTVKILKGSARLKHFEISRKIERLQKTIRTQMVKDIELSAMSCCVCFNIIRYSQWVLLPGAAS